MPVVVVAVIQVRVVLIVVLMRSSSRISVNMYGSTYLVVTTAAAATTCRPYLPLPGKPTLCAVWSM